MSNPNFSPEWSTNQVYVDGDMAVCLTDTLEEMQTDIDGKAESIHTHDGYAPTTHEHTGYASATHEHSGYAPQNHTHTGYAPTEHTHTGFAPTTHGHSYNELSDKPTIPAAYTHPSTHPASMVTGLSTVATSGSYNDLSNKPTIPTIPASLPANGGNADTVDGKHASEFAPTSHSHELSAITGLLDMLLTDTAGRQKLSITGNVLTTIAGLSAGVHTCYSGGGANSTATNAPNTIESWRYLIHKNYAAYGWVLAFGSEGSVFTNYLDNGSWRGWKAIWDNNPSPLWSGTVFMNAAQTVTPSKKLSECKNGWVLLWSDYDTTNGGATNGDVVASYIPKRCYSGSNWAGHSWLVDIPVEASASAESRCVKKVYVWNDRIVGNAINETSPRNDVVLRAVYEF